MRELTVAEKLEQMAGQLEQMCQDASRMWNVSDATKPDDVLTYKLNQLTSLLIRACICAGTTAGRATMIQLANETGETK